MARRPRYGPNKFEFVLSKRNYGFQAQVDEMVITTEKRLIALARESIQRTINDAQLATAKGGRMRVDTGFLRASGQPSYNGMPTGPVRGEKKEPGSYPDDGASVTLALAKLTLGATFYFGWTANYARIREAYDGFLEAAAQKWPDTVKQVTNEIRERVKK